MTAQEMFEQLGGYMNEYQEALNSLRVLSGCEASAKVIQKLIDRATPKKSLIVTQLDEFGDEFGGFEIREWDEDSCPICNRFVGVTDKFCRHCGQAIDWSEEDENTL